MDLAHNGEDAWLLAEAEGYDLLIMDIMMPKRSGLDVLRQLRNRGFDTPVLLLTARDS
ncbi:MAG: response regulator, partial [Burkholderiales bacterium]